MKTIKIEKILGNNIILRSSIKPLKEKISNNTLFLDFEGVDFISRSFADELYSFIENKNIPLEIINTNEVISAIMQAVERTHKEGRKPLKEHIDISKVNNSKELLDFLSAF